jgi:tetratricopeptide (TPR) repeat protein
MTRLYSLSVKLFFLLIVCIFQGRLYSQSPAEIFASVNDAIVVVEAFDFDGSKSGQGSGVILKDKGLLLTNFHIFAGNEKLVIKHKEKELKYTEIIGFSIEKDVLLLKMEDGDFPQIKVGSTQELMVGGKVYAIGSPLGMENTITEGLVGGFRKFDKKENELEYIQISTSLSPGSSGGAVLNSSGELIGISTWGFKKGENVNFAIKIEDVLSVDLGEFSDKLKLEAMNYFFKGKNLHEDNEFKKAVEFYTKYISKVPNDAKAYNFRGLAYMGMKEYEDALKDFNKSAKLDPAYFAPLLNKGDLNYKMENYDNAIKDFTQIIKRAPDLVAAYYARGLAQMKVQEWEDAVKDFTTVIKKEPNYVEAYINRGISYYYDKKYSDAIDNWRKAITLDPTLTNQLNEWIDKADYLWQWQ